MQPKIGQRGIALYIAITITGALVLVAFAIISIALRQINIASVGRDSQAAFYAADSGAECALFWDVKNPTNPTRSAFATTTSQVISCNANVANPLNNNISVGGGQANATSTFDLTFLPDAYCATVTVVKSYIGGQSATKIESRGYNTCADGALRRVERAVRITY
jgi:Tfp pilus assembly protein PilX